MPVLDGLGLVSVFHLTEPSLAGGVRGGGVF